MSTDAIFLDRYRDKNRPLLLFAPSPDDAALREQLAAVEAHRAGFDERDMVLLVVYPTGGTATDAEISHVDADALRNRFGVAEDEFFAVLIGKDGTEKLRSERGVEMDDPFRLIDAMPMRQREMREGRG